MVWWKIALIVIGGVLAVAVILIGFYWLVAIIQEWRYSRKYPDWKTRGGWRP